MKIKRYVADDLPQAVAAIRRELGREAVILSTRRLPRPGWRRLFRRFDRVEVAAAVEEGPVRQSPAPVPPPGPESRPQTPAAAGAPSRPAAAAPASAPPAPAVPGAEPPGTGVALPAAPVPPPASALDVRETASPHEFRQALFRQEIVPSAVRAPEPIRVRPGTRRLVALVGPTGAGKTTTLAKLAAHLHLQQGWRVALVTADTFRVGAVDQLAAYARLLGLPVEVTPTPGALQRALQRLQQADLVLIDTSGRSHHDARRMQELERYLEVAREMGAATRGGEGEGPQGAGTEPTLAPGGLEVHLVLAAATRRAEVEAVVAAYRHLVDRLLITKLDECESPPEVLAVAAAAGLPLSYCSAGQRVPEDLALAWPDRIVAGLPAGETGLPSLRTG